MYQPIAQMKVRHISGHYYLVPIGGEWTHDAELREINDVAALIIESLPGTVDDLVDIVTSEFEVDQQEARDDIRDFLNELIDAGLVSKEEKKL